MRTPVGLLCLACALVAPACGGDSSSDGALADALAYMPAEGATVVVVPTDLESDQIKRFDQVLAPRFTDGLGAEDALRELTKSIGQDVSYDEDVEPLLGDELVVSLSGGLPGSLDSDESPPEQEVVAALSVGDDEAVRALLEKVELVQRGERHGAKLYAAPGEGGSFAAVEDGVLVAASHPAVLDEALARRDGDEHMTEEAFDRSVGDAPRESLVRFAGDLAPVLRLAEVAPFRAVKWIDALRSFGGAVTIEEDGLSLDGSLITDPEGLTDDDLPLPAGTPSPELPQRSDEVNGASADQSRTTVFLLRALRAGMPDARFARDVEKVERSLDIDFEREVLQQFAGPSASALSPDGQFAARSTVRDPERLAEVLRRLAPDLGRLVQDLDGLRSEGLSLLLLFAPDAPVGTGVLGSGRVKVEALPGERAFYRMSNLNPDAGTAPEGLEGPDEVYFGLVGEVFVVASSEERARAIAREPVEAVEGLDGASVTRTDLAAVAEQVERALGFELGQGEFRGSLDVSVERLRARARVVFR